MRTSYKKSDVIFLLKDITGLVAPQTTEEREKAIQGGRHYCEMLPIEYVPSEKYMEVYQEALEHYAKSTAEAVEILARRILEKKGDQVVLVSLARAGTPVGILLKRYIQREYHLTVDHYSISIIRGKGIDENAMKFLLDRYPAENLLFVDGWIGKGAIFGELKKDVAAYPGVSPDIAVLADPADITELCGTHEDILIPSSCLNCTVSGLVSRTFLREDIIGKDDFHGAVYYGELEDSDLSYEFIEAIEKEFVFSSDPVEKEGKREKLKQDIRNGTVEKEKEKRGNGAEEVEAIAQEFGISDINLVKPGIGETTRVLLRRVPWKVLIDCSCKEEKSLAHIVRLAEEKHVPVEYYPLKHYRACGLIRKLADT
ncbi:MAG: cysteine protease StiP family protein [Lachnospiraceae bacterium]|nr:cysteine protease StiP family protein [Lachnospiraceae bacterium]